MKELLENNAEEVQTSLGVSGLAYSYLAYNDSAILRETTQFSPISYDVLFDAASMAEAPEEIVLVALSVFFGTLAIHGIYAVGKKRLSDKD